jgi:hypothetical protein
MAIEALLARLAGQPRRLSPGVQGSYAYGTVTFTEAVLLLSFPDISTAVAA